MENLTPEQIVDGNKLIAEFLGYPANELNEHWLIVPDKTLSQYIQTRELKYHISFDWIMPVVDKISTMAFDNVGEIGFVIYPNRCDLMNSSDDVIIEGLTQSTTLKAVYLAVLSFINWYNLQPK